MFCYYIRFLKNLEIILTRTIGFKLISNMLGGCHCFVIVGWQSYLLAALFYRFFAFCYFFRGKLLIVWSFKACILRRISIIVIWRICLEWSFYLLLLLLHHCHSITSIRGKIIGFSCWIIVRLCLLRLIVAWMLLIWLIVWVIGIAMRKLINRWRIWYIVNDFSRSLLPWSMCSLLTLLTL